MEKIHQKNPARRERLNKEWPINVQAYRCWPLTELPQELWDTAHEMRRLWNDFVFLFRGALKADLKDETGKPQLSSEERAKVWEPLHLQNLREVAKRRKEDLDQSCRELVVNHFLKTVNNWRKAPTENGQPRFQRADEMAKIHIPLDYNKGKSAEWLTNCAGTAGIRYTLDVKKNAPKDEYGNPLLSEEDLEAYLNNGHFCIGITRKRLALHIAYGGRSGEKKYFLPADCRIKAVLLCGKRDSAHGWSWSFQVRLERPPAPARPRTGRVCEWDSGAWRLMDGYIRLGVIADNAGHFYELRLPLEIGALSRRIRREKEYCEKHGWQYTKPMSWDDLEELASRYGKALEACKAEVRKIYEEEKDSWPLAARRRMGVITKMRDAGVRRLRRMLDEIYSGAKQTIDDWDAEAAQLNKTIRSFQIHVSRVKEDAFRQIATWLDAFDRIGWKSDLSLTRGQKRPVEPSWRIQRLKMQQEETGQWEQRTPEERVHENSQKYRQIAGQHKLRQFVKEKHGVSCYCGHHLLQHADIAHELSSESEGRGKCSACRCSMFDSRLTIFEVPESMRTCAGYEGAIRHGSKLSLACENGHARDQGASTSLLSLNKLKGCVGITAPALDIPVHLRPYLRLMDEIEVRLSLTDAVQEVNHPPLNLDGASLSKIVVGACRITDELG